MTGNSRACGRRVLTVVPAPKTRSGVPVGLEQEGVGSMRKSGRRLSVPSSTSQTPKWRVLRPHWTAWADVRSVRKNGGMAGYVWTTGLVALTTLLLWLPRQLFEPVNIALLYLLPVLWSAVRWGWWTSFYAAVLGVMAFDFFFVPPIFSYAVSDLRYLLSFAVFLIVGALTAGLTSSLQHQAQEARRRETVMMSLYDLSRHIAAVKNIDEVVEAVVRHVSETMGVAVWVVLPDAAGHLAPPGHAAGGARPWNHDVLQWVFQHGEPVGFGQRHKPELLYIPLKTVETVHGVMCLGEYGQGSRFGEEQRHTLDALAGLAAVSVARVRYEEAAHQAQLMAESERLHTALLDSLSHELRTPLTAVMGAVDHLADGQQTLSAESRRDLLATVRDGVMRLNRLITNLLGMVRLESGMLRLNRQACDASDLVGVVLRQLQEVLKNHPVSVSIPDDLGPVMVDEVLFEQALVNVVSNAAKYSLEGSPIEIVFTAMAPVLQVAVRDQGIGINPEEAAKLFEKFYRSPRTQHIPGTGLGLAICRGIVQAHGGRVYAAPNSPTGTAITIEIPWNPVA